MKISFVDQTKAQGTLILGVYKDKQLSSVAQKFDHNHGGVLANIINTQKFYGKFESILAIPMIGEVSQVVLIGLGHPEKLCAMSFRKLGAKIAAVALKGKHEKIWVDLSCCHGDLTNGQAMGYLAEGLSLRSWSFNKYKTKLEKDETPVFNEAIITTSELSVAQALHSTLDAISQGNKLTRHVVSEPPNVIYPEAMAQQAKELEALGVKVEVLNEKEMAKLGMNALLGVGQGSVRESQLVVMQWLGGSKEQKPIAIVGKGVTFDTGGISIKPANNMEDMKYDMAGSGVVLGLMKSLSLRKAKVNVVGVMGLAENMPSGSAQRPADVVTSMSGQTIEVVNTDAEGRLVLADALWYTQDRFKPQVMIDLATLTGAITVALGCEYGGLFANDDNLANQLFNAAQSVGEPLWRLPLSKEYDKDINSDIADVKNVGSGRGAGSTTAAQFLQRFVNNVTWAHLDIAGMAWDKKNKPLTGKGATGYGVRLLNEFLRHNYE